MPLERLANELLLDLFAYLDSADLLRAFYGLNRRFNQLLACHLRQYTLALQSISKKQFDELCKEYLPSVVDQLVSLRLSDDETPGLPALLLLHRFRLDRFLRLEALTLHKISSLEVLQRILDQCQSLPSLASLTITKHDFEDPTKDQTAELLRKIWSLPKLRCCHCPDIQTDDEALRTLTRTASALEDLALEHAFCCLQGLSHLLQRAPNLRRLSVRLYAYALDDRLTFTSYSLTSLKLLFGGSIRALTELFEHLPHLSHLAISTVRTRLDGHIWEELIRTGLPKLEKFQLHMEMTFHENNIDIDDAIDELLTTFTTAFWRCERQWPVRCHWNPSDPYKFVTLYTLPYPLETFTYSNKSSTKSTCVRNQQCWMYDAVQKLDYGNIEDISLNRFYLFPALFSRLRSLTLYLPVDDEQFFRHFPSLSILQSLTVHLYKSRGYEQLQRLFKCMSSSLSVFRFHSLTTGFPAQLFQLPIAKPIRRVDFTDFRPHHNHHCTREECLVVCRSPLVRHCEVLSIRIKHRPCISELIEHLPNLRLLIVVCEGDDSDTSKKPTSTSSKSEFDRWLEEHLPPSYSIQRNPQHRSHIYIWIHRQTAITSRCDSARQGFGQVNVLSRFVRSFRQLFESNAETDSP